MPYFVDIKDLETGETLFTALEILDQMLGTSYDDDRLILFLPDGEQMIFEPRTRYLVSSHVEESEKETDS